MNSNLREKEGKLLICPAGISPSYTTDVAQWKLVVPKSLTPKLIEQAHDPPSSAHLGVAKTVERLRRQFFWPGMMREVRQYIQRCEICKQCKPINYSSRPLMGKFMNVSRPFQRLYIDFLGPYPRSRSGNSYLLIVVDQFSRFVLLKPLREATAKLLVEFIEQQIFCVFSVPEFVFTDNGKQFISKLFKSLLEKYGIKHTFTPKYSPQPNASERVNRTLLASIRSYIKNSHKEWDHNIHEIASALRNVKHESTEFSPHFLVFGEHKINHASEYDLYRLLNVMGENQIEIYGKPDRLSLIRNEVLDHLKAAHIKTANRYNLRSRDRKFSPGDIVFIRNFTQSDKSQNYSSKLAPQYLKAKIVKPIGNVAYEVSEHNSNRILGTYHLKDIRKS